MPDHATQFGYAEGGVVAALGFLASGVSAGIKRNGKRDLCLVAAEEPVSAAAVFTRNTMAAPPVALSRRHVANGHVRAVVINSGNANACTGEQGMRDAESMARSVAERLGCTPEEVVVGSTGVIGVPMPIDLVTTGIAEAAAGLDARALAGDAAAEAIMTTDTFAKQTALAVDVAGARYTVGGIAKAAA